MSLGRDFLPDSIYNRDNKTKYINYLCNTKIQWESLHSYINPFITFAKYEKYYQMDILEMSKNKIAVIFEMTIKSYAIYINYCSILKDYYKFYGKNFEIVRPSFEELDIVSNFEGRYIRDFNMLLELNNKAFPLTDGSLDEFRKLVIMLCYIGFKKQEVRKIRSCDVDFLHNSISCETHTIDHIPLSCMRLCEKCIDMTEVYLNNTAHLPYSKRTFFPLYNNEYLIRIRYEAERNNGNPVPDTWLGRTIVAFNKNTDGDYSYETIRASGLYEWLYKQEQSGDFDPNQPRRTLEKIYAQHFKTKCSGSNLSKNYDIWKQIFYGY